MSLIKRVPPELLAHWTDELKKDSADRGGQWVEIESEPASKANSRRIVWTGKGQKKRPLVIKSDKAISFAGKVASPLHSSPGLVLPFTDDVTLVILIRYATRRPDMDESLILDGLQGIMFENDRQVSIRIAAATLDKARPGAFVYGEPMARSLESGLPRLGQPVQAEPKKHH